MQFAGDTDILISWIYKLTLNQQMYDIAAVMSVLLFIFVGVVSLWNFRRTTSVSYTHLSLEQKGSSIFYLIDRDLFTE